jgi:hypothetical protein
MAAALREPVMPTHRRLDMTVYDSDISVWLGCDCLRVGWTAVTARRSTVARETAVTARSVRDSDVRVGLGLRLGYRAWTMSLRVVCVR